MFNTPAQSLSKKTVDRALVDREDKWNVEALYKNWEEWESELSQVGQSEGRPRFSQISAFDGKLADPAKLSSALDLILALDRHLSKLYTYAHLRHDEDVAEEVAKKAYNRVVGLLYEFRQASSWVEPQLLRLADHQIQSLLGSDILKQYRLYLEKIVRLKPHTLPAEQEMLMALAGKPLETAQKVFSALNNADLKFPDVEDSQGQKHPLTHGTYLVYLRNKDRKLRKEAFCKLQSTYSNYENTLCELIQGLVEKHEFERKARSFNSSLQAALFPHQIEESVYLSLISCVKEHLPSLHHYMRMRKGVLGVDKLHLYDLYVSMIDDVSFHASYEKAEQMVIESVAPLGKEYQSVLENGMKQDRWVDRFENVRKRSGAYSSGCYDSMPYILMNYQGTLNDVMTLSHEAGHSMHSYMSNAGQPYQYAQYPIFLAEVASTFHEQLLFTYMLKKAGNVKEKAFLLNQRIDDIRATFFRQTMFAEFELTLHRWVEEGHPLTPALLKQEYKRLNEQYFGPDVVIDEEITIEWARIPHFYYNFYVYQYATGISAAFALVEKLFQEGEPARKRYLQFISSGASGYPLDLLSAAGVDMRKTDPIKSLLSHFTYLVQELDACVKQ